MLADPASLRLRRGMVPGLSGQISGLIINPRNLVLGSLRGVSWLFYIMRAIVMFYCGRYKKNVMIDNSFSAGYNTIECKLRIVIIFFGGL